MALIGNIEDLKWPFDHEVAIKSGSPIYIDTPRMEVRVILLNPGVYPPYHAHHPEMDEGYLIYGGKGLIHNSGETFDVKKGNILLNPRGAMHHMKNTGQEGLIEFNFRGGRMPSGFIMPEGNPPPNPDPDRVGNPAEVPVPYIRGNVEDFIGRFDEGAWKRDELPKAISTEFLEVRIVSFAPGDGLASHRHLGEVDGAALVMEGQMDFEIEGEETSAGPGDLIHIPGGAWNRFRNPGEGDSIIFHIIGGSLPARAEWRE